MKWFTKDFDSWATEELRDFLNKHSLSSGMIHIGCSGSDSLYLFYLSDKELFTDEEEKKQGEARNPSLIEVKKPWWHRWLKEEGE